MSDYTKDVWCDIWDGLYWRFINKHRVFFLKNPRMAVMVGMYDKINPERKKLILDAADNFLAHL
jgi:deoxyribodipyrimidine photolyase-related protein